MSMRPNYLPAVLAILAIVGVLGGTLYYFSHTLGGSDSPVGKAVEAFVLEPPPPTWRDDQVSAPNVQLAIQQKGAYLRKTFEKHGVAYPPRMASIRIFKDEQVLELWAGPTDEGTLTLVDTFPLCLEHRDILTVPHNRPAPGAAPSTHALPGKTRPEAGEEPPPIPEGFYSIDRYFSRDFTYFLSLKLDYPNPADRAREPRRRRFPDLFVRGGCERGTSVHLDTEGIMAVYLVVMEAHAAGQAKVPVHVFPSRMTPEVTSRLIRSAGRNARQRALFEQLRQGYDLFEQQHLPLVPTVDARGDYVFSSSDATPSAE